MRCDGWNKNIKATIFGGKADPNDSAYTGVYLDDNTEGIALPDRLGYNHFPAKVEIENVANGQKTTACVVDIGPFYDAVNAPADPYWCKGSRPRAESDRQTNGAGIDLLPKTADELQIQYTRTKYGLQGDGRVNWRFIK
jgi:hypothetical protein